MWQILSGVFLGWSLGSNDASNVFGTAVASRMVKFWTAAILGSFFVILGSILEGTSGMETYTKLSSYGINFAFIVSLSAAISVMIMTVFKLPVSTSQAVVGSILAMGTLQGSAHWGGLTKVVLCWVGTPIGAMFFSILLYHILGALFNWLDLSLFNYDKVFRWLLVIAGSYGAYALGANNVANVTGPFVSAGAISPFAGVIIGGFSIAFGILTYSRNVMLTVGKGLVKLNAFSAFIVVLSEAITVHIYAVIGVPVSTSQAVVGAVLGIGVIRGVKTVNKSVLTKIVIGWLSTPVLSFAFTYGSAYILIKLGIL